MYVKEKLDISKYFVVGPENTNGLWLFRSPS